MLLFVFYLFFFFKQKTAYEMRISDWSSDVCSSDLLLFIDTYAAYFEPNIGLAAINLLEGCGYEVIVRDVGCCQRPRMSKGMVRQARQDEIGRASCRERVCQYV